MRKQLERIYYFIKFVSPFARSLNKGNPVKKKKYK